MIGGGVLGCAAAISIQRRLARAGGAGRVAVLEKSVVGAGLSARHSGIVRAANAVTKAAAIADRAADLWRHLGEVWGAAVRFDAPGALWIASDTGGGRNEKWSEIGRRVAGVGIEFRQISFEEARELCPGHVRVNRDEVFFWEPGAILLDPTDVRRAMYEGLACNGVEVFEECGVTGFDCGNGVIRNVVAGDRSFSCRTVINAAGPWSPSVLGPLGVEPVHVANWMTSIARTVPEMPVIADYVNLAYFRSRRHGEIHMHQPRKRALEATARAFSDMPLAMTGADVVTDPANDGLGYSQLSAYEEIARRSFTDISRTVYASGYRSYFDITPDLRFILGPDPRLPDLVHCLGSGQALKYAPVFGELMADCVCEQSESRFDIDEFSIARFDDAFMRDFWARAASRNNTLEQEAVTI